MIRFNRRITFDEIATKLNMSLGTVYLIVNEKLHFSIISRLWVLKILTDIHKVHRLLASRASLPRYKKEGDDFL